MQLRATGHQALMAGVLAVCVYTIWTRVTLAQAPYQCEMTYMYPSYELVNVTSALSGRYRLYQYVDLGPDVASREAKAGNIRCCSGFAFVYTPCHQAH